MNAIEIAERAVLCALFRRYPDGLVWIGGSVLQLLYDSPRASYDLDLCPSGEMPPAEEVRAAVREALEQVNATSGSRLIVDEFAVQPGLVRLKVTEGGELRFMVDLTLVAGQIRDAAAVVVESVLGPQAVRVATDSRLLMLKLEALLFRRFLKPADVFDVWFLLSRGVRLKPNQRAWLSDQVRMREMERADVKARFAKLTPERFLADLKKRMAHEAFHRWNPAGAQQAIRAALNVVRKEIEWP
jgi:hypothetical protein